jgi:putative membrane protein
MAAFGPPFLVPSEAVGFRGQAVTTDLIFSYLHFILVFVMVGSLAGELLLVRPGLDSATLKRVGMIDAIYGAGAVLLLLAGFGRMYFGLKDADFYWQSGAFHIKLTLFVLIALASLPPTIRYLQWRKGFKEGGRTSVSDSEIASVRRWLHAEAGLLVLMPLFAGLMARGMM